MVSERYTVIPRTCNFVFNENGEILLLKFSEVKGGMAGFYDPPGGHIEEGEGILESARREIKEETGLEVENLKLKGVVHVTNFFGKNLCLFITMSMALHGKLVECEEGTLHWVDQEKLDEIKIFEDLKLILEKVLDNGSAFVAKSRFNKNGKLESFEFE